MGKPVQQHYLPKAAYLRFFEIPERRGYIYLYQREKPPVCTNIEKVARERHLYSFVDKNGVYNYEVENALAQLENQATPILEKLNSSAGLITISGEEKALIASFIAFLAVRTPAFMEVIRQMGAAFAEMYAMAMAQDKKVLSRAVERMKRTNPGRISDEITVKELEEFILGGDYETRVSGDRFRALALKLARAIYPSILIKRMAVLKVKGEKFVTSDHPVSLVPDKSVPVFYRGGFLMSNILIPISSHAALFLVNAEEPEPVEDPSQSFFVRVEKISGFKVRQINKYAMAYAENYIFASYKSDTITRLFAQTRKPVRFQISHPFRRRLEQQGK